MPGPVVSNLILRVADLGAARRFWSGALGLPIVGESPGFCFLDGGSVRIALNHAEGGDPAAGESTTEIVLEVEDAEATYAAWSEAGVEFETELREVMADGDRRLVAAHFRDPDGHLVSITGWT